MMQIQNLFTMLLLFSLMTSPAHAGFWFGESEVKSGLDFNKGYDINTVTTVSGKVVAPPRQAEQDHVMIEIEGESGRVDLAIAPKEFWKKIEFPARTGDQIVARGARAQGADGKTYIIVQKVTNKTTGIEAGLRTRDGSPFWLGHAGSGTHRERPGEGQRHQGGMMRGGGMMRR